MGGVGRGGFWAGCLLRGNKANGENAASSARARQSRFKIATNVVGVIESSVPRRPQVPWEPKQATAQPSFHFLNLLKGHLPSSRF